MPITRSGRGSPGAGRWTETDAAQLTVTWTRGDDRRSGRDGTPLVSQCFGWKRGPEADGHVLKSTNGNRRGKIGLQLQAAHAAQAAGSATRNTVQGSDGAELRARR